MTVSSELVSFEIGNGFVRRKLECASGRVRTVSLASTDSACEYIERAASEFGLTVSHGSETTLLTSDDFELIDHEEPQSNQSVRTLRLDLQTIVSGKALKVSVFYEAREGEDCIRKWLQVHPCDLEDFIVRGVTIESLRLKKNLQGVAPYLRWPDQYDNAEDKVQSALQRPNAECPDTRFSFGDSSRSVVRSKDVDEGLYFFAQTLLGNEKWSKDSGLVMGQREFAPIKEGVTTGPAVIGVYSGPPEIGFKRYTQHMMREWCAIRDKDLPVSWNSWFVTLENNKSLLANYDRDYLMECIDRMGEVGFYDVLHMDLGWEAGWSMRVNTEKFPNGMEEVVDRAKIAGADLAYWVNPYSSMYWVTDAETEHPEWLAPGMISKKSGGKVICPLTPYSDYVEKRFVELATQLNARIIYWDGLDWTIQECVATDHDHQDKEELEVKAWKRMAKACAAAHSARKDLMFVVFSLPFDNHRLSVLDQEQVSDTFSHPGIVSELVHRQQLYQMTWEHPYKAIWGSWYGVDWRDTGYDNLVQRPLEELIHSEMSMIGNGIAQAGGSFNLDRAKPEFMEFMTKLFAFRKLFQSYFDTYQHVLAFPDGEHVDGEGHIIDGKGFITLVNPTRETKKVVVPLSEPELELSPGKTYEITDWSNLEHGLALGTARTSDALEIELAPLQVRYIGVDIG